MRRLGLRFIGFWLFGFALIAQAQAGFDLKVEPARLNLEAGSEATLTLTLTPKGGFKGQVSLALVDAKGNPVKGYGLLPKSLSLEGQPLRQTLFLQPPADLKPGTYTLTLVANAGGAKERVALTFTVRQPLGFALGAPNPQVVTLKPGEMATVLIPAAFGKTPDYVRSGTYGFRIDTQGEIPKGLSLQWQRVPGGFGLRLALGWDDYPKPGTYVLPLRAQDYTERGFLFTFQEPGKVIRTTRLLVQVAPPPSFTLDAPQPGALEVRQGSGQNFLLPITLGQFKGKVNLSVEGLPQGVSLKEEKREEKEGRILVYYRLEASLDAPLGDRTLTLQATDAPGYLRQTRNLTLKIAAPPTFGVNTTQDTIDAFPGDGVCADEKGQCSLRAAIMEANALKAPVVIQLPPGTYTLTRESPTDEQGGDLNIMTSVILRGAGPETILDGGGKFRVIRIHESATLVVEDLTVRNGFANRGGGIFNEGILSLNRAVLERNRSSEEGGAIYSRGRLFLRNSVVRDNKADGSGGGFASFNVANLEDVVMENNWAGENGGGFYASGEASLSKVKIVGNAAEQDGGGFYVREGWFRASGSIVQGNRAGDPARGFGDGGGFYSYSAKVAVDNSTFSNNTAGGFGGGIYAAFETVSLLNVTVSHNKAVRNGGGVGSSPPAGHEAEFRLSFVTITANEANAGGGILGSAIAKGLILAGNTATSGTGPQCQGSLTSRGYNLIGSIQDCDYTRAEGDMGGQDPRLGPLGDDGGPVPTLLPLPGSPVLDRVPPEQCTDLEGKRIETDARGVSRPQGRACDIGAVERN